MEVNMIKVAICDDIPEITGTVEKMLEIYNTTLFDISVFFSCRYPDLILPKNISMIFLS